MTKRLLVILISSTFVLAGCGGGSREEERALSKGISADEAYQQVRTKRKEMDSVEEKLALTKKYLKHFPVSEQTASAIDAIYYYQAEALGDTTGAIAYAEQIRSRVSDPGIAKEIDKLLIRFYGESGSPGKMMELADQLAAAGAMDFDDHWNVIEGAVHAENWELVRNYCAKARGMANAETCRAENPGHDFTEEELGEVVNDRVGMLLVKDGWARANQGQIDEALADFARADNLVPRYYFDIPEYDLNVYWARTLIMKGDFEAAIERFARNGLIMRNEDALAGLKEAYIGIHGDESGLAAYAEELHRSIATTIDDFEMADYKGELHRFSDLRSDVTVLTLWFPT